MTYEHFEESFRRRRSSYSVILFVATFIFADLTTVLLSFGGGFFVVNAYNIDLVDLKSFITYWPYLPAFLVVFYVARLYPGLNLAPAEELRRFIVTSLVGHSGIILSRLIGSHNLDAYSWAFALSWLVSVPVFALLRGIVRHLCKDSGWWRRPVVVFGGGKTGRMVIDRLLSRSWIGYRPVAILDDDPALEGGEYRGVPVIGKTSLGPSVAERCLIQTAIVAMPGVPRDRLTVILADYVREFRNYILIPDFMGMTNIWMSVSDFDGILGLQTTQRLIQPGNLAVKRIFDLVLGILIGLVLLPILAVIALVVVIDSPGPAFFGQRRLGKGGKEFTAWKYRSMATDAEDRLEKLLAEDPMARKEWEASRKLRSDPRVTRMGRFLRRTSLDEFPQLWNVIRGEMSLIGPRPIVEEEVEMYSHYYKLFSSVKPGMTGLWQVSGRSDLDYSERVALDVYYIRSWSVWLDLHILFRTPAVFFTKNGAY
jgi:Undecaprenyl-phosphate galactose phosphotransferase WbaP